MRMSLLPQLVGHYNSMGPVKLSIVSPHNSSWEVEPKFNHGSLLGSFFRFFIQKGKEDQMHGDARSKVRKSPPSWENFTAIHPVVQLQSEVQFILLDCTILYSCCFYYLKPCAFSRWYTTVPEHTQTALITAVTSSDYNGGNIWFYTFKASNLTCIQRAEQQPDAILKTRRQPRVTFGFRTLKVCFL